MASERTSLGDIRDVLQRARTVAVLGAHPDPTRPAHYVPAYLLAQGYKILPVNPAYAGSTMFGKVVRAKLSELREPVDIVDVFRRGPDVPGHLDDILAMEPRPALVWLQLGIRNDVAAKSLVESGVDVIQDRCTLADHRAMGIGPVR